MDLGNIGMMILLVIGGLTGLVTTVAISIGLPAVIIWKLYRRIAKGIPVTQ